MLFRHLIFFSKSFLEIFSFHEYHQCQIFWILIRLDVLSSLIPVQTVCKSYQQTTLVGKEKNLCDGLLLKSRKILTYSVVCKLKSRLFHVILAWCHWCWNYVTDVGMMSQLLKSTEKLKQFNGTYNKITSFPCNFGTLSLVLARSQ